MLAIQGDTGDIVRRRLPRPVTESNGARRPLSTCPHKLDSLGIREIGWRQRLVFRAWYARLGHCMRAEESFPDVVCPSVAAQQILGLLCMIEKRFVLVLQCHGHHSLSGQLHGDARIEGLLAGNGQVDCSATSRAYALLLSLACRPSCRCSCCGCMLTTTARLYALQPC